MKQRHITTIVIISVLVTALAALATFFIIHSSVPDLPEEAPTTSDPVPGDQAPYNFDYSWAETSPYIAHALGEILGDIGTNSLEAFELNYQLGHRIFEADLCLTDDNQLVLAHDPAQWHSIAKVQVDSDPAPLDTPDPTLFTYANFQSSLWHNRYHTLTFDDLLHLLKKYPDAYIVTDIKASDQAHTEYQFAKIVAAARAIDEKLLDRIIPQIYFPEMLDYVMDTYPWKSLIYTLYANVGNWTPENVLAFSKASGIKFITMWGSWINSDIMALWQPTGIQVATHTINNLSSVNQLRALGVKTFYTDSLLP